MQKALAKADGDPVVAAIKGHQDLKTKAQLDEGRRVLAEDPDGVGDYNAFVNEPAEPVARITLDEEASGIDFIADTARIKNNVGTYEGRARPILDDKNINALSNADASQRASILAKVEGDLGAEFELTVGGQKLTRKDVAEAVDSLYDTALVADEGFQDALTSYQKTQVKLLEIVDSVSDLVQEIYRRTRHDC